MLCARWKDDAAMQLILVRHGQPEVPNNGHSGNPPLSARGHEQAQHAARVLRDEGVDRIMSSGMHRADSTAQALADATGLTIDIHPHLGEVDRYGGEYASIEAIREKGPAEWARFKTAPLAFFGVDADQFRAETLGAFADVLGQNSARKVAIFTHGFPINLLLGHVLGLPDEARFVPFYASISRLVGTSLDDLTIISINENGHIPRGLR
jgi:broad specificity phosphatase PhoE